MKVYKITDANATYSGGMALVAAISEYEALGCFRENSDIGNYNETFKAELIDSLNYESDYPTLITEDWYYE